MDLGMLDGLIGYHLRRASGTFAADFSRALDGTGMRQVLFGVMSVVQANPGIKQGEVGRVLGVQRANMVVLVNELIAFGWITRSVSKSDRRAVALDLTAVGVGVFKECADRIRRHEDRLLSRLSAKEREALITALDIFERPAP